MLIFGSGENHLATLVASCLSVGLGEWESEMIISIRYAGWMSGRIVSLELDTDIQNLISNGNRIGIRISETLLSTFRGFRLLDKAAHCTIIHLLFPEASFFSAFCAMTLTESVYGVISAP